MDKKEALALIFQGAALFKRNFVGKNLLYFYGNPRSPEVMETAFFGGNFLHLTGVKLSSNLSAVKFFDNCLEKRLREKDIDFKGDGTTELKLEILSHILKPSSSARMVGNFIGSGLYLQTEKLVGGQYAAIGFIKYEHDNSHLYIPNTIINGDIRERIDKPRRVLAIYEKAYYDDKYSSCIYLAKNIEKGKMRFPKEFSYLGSSEVQIHFHKKYLGQTKDKFEPEKVFNTITLPKGTTLNGEDVSGCTVHPKEIRESEGNPDEVLAVFHKDGSLPCLINLNKEGINLKRVDVEELKIAVDLQRNNEVELQRERAEEKNNTLEHNKNTDKGEGLE